MAFLFLSFFFFQKAIRLENKRKMLRTKIEKESTKEQPWKPCYSFEHAQKYTNEPKKLWTPSAWLMYIGAMLPWIIAAILLMVEPFILVLLVALAGIAIFNDEETFEAYRYYRAIQKVSIGHLRREDLGYIDSAKEALHIGTLRFLAVGIIFVVAGPYFQQVLSTLIFVIGYYLGISIEAAEATFTISQILGLFMALSLPIFLLILPEFFARFVFRGIKSLARRVLRLKRE
ncbi:MAG: hypothetical protein ACETVM_01600 [Candidatus Bathyarchaeia archaeon]